jgi:hypothetical protein
VSKRFLTLFLFLTACTQAPFVDMRREAGQVYTVGQSTPDRVAICYNKYSTHSSEVIHMAQEECRKTGREAKYDGESRWSCRVFLPHRVYFKCVAPPESDLKKEIIVPPAKDLSEKTGDAPS